MFKPSAARTLPNWIVDIKEEAQQKIINASFASACRAGDLPKMQALIIGLWPFVNAFPKIIIRGALHVSQDHRLVNKELINTFLHRGRQVLTGISKDEENHRRLWLETGQALGLKYPSDFDRPSIREVEVWIEAVSSSNDPFSLFLSFTAIEIIAETVSLDFLSSAIFKATLGKRGCDWFRVHAEHAPGMSHEEMELRLAFAFLEGEPDKAAVNDVLLGVVDLFVSAANASVGIIQ